MLQLAQKTDGVIVTNDNLRDLSDESAVWRDIVKKRYKQEVTEMQLPFWQSQKCTFRRAVKIFDLLLTLIKS